MSGDSPVAHGLKSVDFRKSREASWVELDELLHRATRFGRPLTSDELMRLPMLYRTTLSSLSIARSIALDKSLEAYLENLCLRTFLYLNAPRLAPDEHILRMLFPPGAFKALRPCMLVALGTIVLGMVTGICLVLRQPLWAPVLMHASLISQHDGPMDNLFMRILPISLLATGTGLFLALPSLVLLAWHGVVLGAVSLLLFQGAVIPADYVLGMFTLAATLLLCGTAGLRLGWALLFPGPLRRMASVVAYSSVMACMVSSASAIALIGALGAWMAS